MGALLGSPGQMVEFAQWREEQSVTHGRALNVVETIGGGSFAFRAPRVRRTWQLKSTGLRPEQAMGFEMLAYGALGPGPFWLIDPEARVTNALTPAQSLAGMDGNLAGFNGDALPGPKVILPSGMTVPSIISGGARIFAPLNIPVLPGVPLNVSVHVSSGATVALNYVDVNGSYLSQVGAFSMSAGTGLVRASKTNTPPAAAASAYLTIDRANTLAAPALTFTPLLMPWTVGRGCSRVALGSWDKSFEYASPDPTGRKEATITVTVEEVGEGA